MLTKQRNASQLTDWTRSSPWAPTTAALLCLVARVGLPNSKSAHFELQVKPTRASMAGEAYQCYRPTSLLTASCNLSPLFAHTVVSGEQSSKEKPAGRASSAILGILSCGGHNHRVYARIPSLWAPAQLISTVRPRSLNPDPNQGSPGSPRPPSCPSKARRPPETPRLIIKSLQRGHQITLGLVQPGGG